MPHEQVIVGDAVAGESAQTRAALEQLIEHTNRSNFDIADLLHRIKSRGFYAPYNTFDEYGATLKIKRRKRQYLVKMAETFATVGIPRTQYEPLGIARCRAITSLDPAKTWRNPETGEETPLREFIATFVDQGDGLAMETLQQHVRTLKGFTGENDLVWLNFCVTRSAAENTIRPALEKMKGLIGSAGKDDEGISKDASEGAALEAMAVEILNDNHLTNGDVYVDSNDTFEEEEEEEMEASE